MIPSLLLVPQRTGTRQAQILGPEEMPDQVLDQCGFWDDGVSRVTVQGISSLTCMCVWRRITEQGSPGFRWMRRW